MCSFLSWYFGPDQPQRIVSGLKTNLNLSPTHFAHKSSHQNTHSLTSIKNKNKKTKHTYTNVKQNFRRISHFGFAPVYNTLVSWTLP